MYIEDLVFELKDILDIPYNNTTHDKYFETCIPLFTEYIQEYCNNSFLNDLGEVQLKGGAKISLAKMIEFNMVKTGITSKKFGEVSYSYNLDFPQSILNLLEPYMRIKV
jgi:hypothetical protein